MDDENVDMERPPICSGAIEPRSGDRSGVAGRRAGRGDAGSGRCDSPYDMAEGESARIANDGSSTIQVIISLPSFRASRK
jgi:hypothetical protein